MITADVFFLLIGQGLGFSIFIRNGGRAVIADFLFAFFFHIIGGLRRGVEIHRVLFPLPHYQITRAQQVLHSAAIAAIRDAQRMLKINRAEGKRKAILVAAKIQIQSERDARQQDKSFLPFVDADLNKISFIFRLVDSNDALIGVCNSFFCHIGLFLLSNF